jgi:hypothetical protein
MSDCTHPKTSLPRIGVVGSRSFANRQQRPEHWYADCLFGYNMLDRLRGTTGDFCVVSGGAPGSDRLAEEWADHRGLPCEVHKADWVHLGKRAGAVRNKIIVDRVAGLLAFWDGRSPGTAITIGMARDKGIPIVILNYLRRDMAAIELISSRNGDWDELRVDGKTFHSGHSIPAHEWLRLLVQLGHPVEEREVPVSFFTGDPEDDRET